MDFRGTFIRSIRKQSKSSDCRVIQMLAASLERWTWLYRLLIRLIMQMTHGPTDTTAVIDYTNWDDVRAYGTHLLTLR